MTLEHEKSNKMRYEKSETRFENFRMSIFRIRRNFRPCRNFYTLGNFDENKNFAKNAIFDPFSTNIKVRNPNFAISREFRTFLGELQLSTTNPDISGHF